MQDKEQRRGGLRRRIAQRWTPLFEDEAEVAPLSDEEFAAACDWERLRSTGVVAAHEEPLGIAGLRLSSIFPRHLLRRRDDGRLVPIAFDDAVALVRLTLAQDGRGHATDRALEGTHAIDDVTDAAGSHTATGGTADGTADGDTDGDTDGADDVGATVATGMSDNATDDGRGRRRFFRRRS